jgi:hypothetical protein
MSRHHHVSALLTDQIVCGLPKSAGPARPDTRSRSILSADVTWLRTLNLLTGVGPVGRVPAAHGAGPEPQQLQRQPARGLGRGRGVVPQPHRAVSPFLSLDSCRAQAQAALPMLGAVSGRTCRRSPMSAPAVRWHRVTSVWAAVEICAVGGALSQDPGGCAAP